MDNYEIELENNKKRNERCIQDLEVWLKEKNYYDIFM